MQLATRMRALLFASLCFPAVSQGASGSQELLDQQQDRDSLRREQRIVEIYRPGPAPLPELQAPAGEDKPCFRIARITFEGADAVLSGAARKQITDEYLGRCIGIRGVRELQAALTRRLIEDGYVTSRVLLPEQDLSAGELRLRVVAGRIEDVAGDGTGPRTIAIVFPDSAGDVLHLPGLEQAIENIGRLPGRRATLDIVAGERDGTSRIVVKDPRGRPWELQASVDGQGIEDEADTLGRLAVIGGDLLGFAERVMVAGSRKLDDHRIDESESASLNLDLPMGYWRFAAVSDRQQFRDAIAGAVQTFVNDGTTRMTRLEAGRVLYRRGNNRLAATLIGGDSEVTNRIDGTVLEVSSYSLRTLAARLEHSTVYAGAQWNAWLTAEHGGATGPATHPLGGQPIADTDAVRLQVYVRRSRPWRNGQTALVQTINGQYSASRLFPLQQMSLLTQNTVRGYVDNSANGSNALALRAEITHDWLRASERLPGAWQPYGGIDAGWIPNDNTVARSARAVSATLGLLCHDGQWQWRLAVTDPVGGISTLGPTGPVLSTTLVWTY